MFHLIVGVLCEALWLALFFKVAIPINLSCLLSIHYDGSLLAALTDWRPKCVQSDQFSEFWPQRTLFASWAISFPQQNEQMRDHLSLTHPNTHTLTHTPNPKLMAKNFDSGCPPLPQWAPVFTCLAGVPKNLGTSLSSWNWCSHRFYFECELSWMCQNFPLRTTVIKLPVAFTEEILS